MGKEVNSFSYGFYSFIESIGIWLSERGEKIQGWALCKMGHNELASLYSPIVPEKTSDQIHDLLEEAGELENDLKAINCYQEALKLMSPYMIQKRENGELFLDDQIENEIGISYEEVCQSLFDLLLENKKYAEASELCLKNIKLDLGFSKFPSLWSQNLTEIKRKQNESVNNPKISRNAPCPCGSGKKYKKCCGKDLL